MLYTEQQVVAMINLARTNTTTSAEDIMSEMEAVYLPDDDLINDYGYDEAGPDGMDDFKDGGEWVKQYIYSGIRSANEELERQLA
jgi:hypothetical protein